MNQATPASADQGAGETATSDQSGDVKRFEQKPMRRVLNSWPRCGTNFLRILITEAHGKPAFNLLERVHEPGVLQATMDSEQATQQLFYEHLYHNKHSAVLNPTTYPDLRMVYLHRHPLDQFISNAFYQTQITGMWRDRVPNPDADPYVIARERLLGMYDAFRGSAYHKSYLADFEQQVLGWLECGYCHVIRFEDLVTDTENVLKNCLDFLEVRYDDADIKKIVAKNSFENLSGGRKPGELNKTHHYRRGTPGEWQDVFKPEDLPILREKYGAHFARQGYPI